MYQMHSHYFIVPTAQRAQQTLLQTGPDPGQQGFGPELDPVQQGFGPELRRAAAGRQFTASRIKGGSNTATNPAPASNPQPLRGGANSVSKGPAASGASKGGGWLGFQRRALTADLRHGADRSEESSEWDKRSGTQRNQSPSLRTRNITH
ncbi:hypothetical protein NQZ68_038090 [Dissostichus eleginoides]|nr:hypothetical protein NQZ68_038090 [Dissostichus eleginoides]